MMDSERVKKSHQSKFVKKFFYYIIVFMLQIGLTLYTVAITKKDIIMVNTVGKTYIFTPSHVFITLGVGWAAFGLALVFNLVYYVLHPSQVNVKNIKEKLVVSVFGYEINLMNYEWTCRIDSSDEENQGTDEEVDPLQMREIVLDSRPDLEEVVTSNN